MLLTGVKQIIELCSGNWLVNDVVEGDGELFLQLGVAFLSSEGNDHWFVDSKLALVLCLLNSGIEEGCGLESIHLRHVDVHKD